MHWKTKTDIGRRDASSKEEGKLYGNEAIAAAPFTLALDNPTVRHLYSDKFNVSMH
jgi:hypothetical protein